MDECIFLFRSLPIATLKGPKNTKKKLARTKESSRSVLKQTFKRYGGPGAKGFRIPISGNPEMRLKIHIKIVVKIS